MKYTGRTITMEVFVFSKEVDRKEELSEWRNHFLNSTPSIHCVIHRKENGKYILLREGKEACTTMPCNPSEGPCKFCGKKSPHTINHYKYCNDECMCNDYNIKRRENEKD